MTVESQLIKMKESKCFVPTLTFLAGKIKTTDESWLATALREFHEESAGLLQNVPELSSLCREIDSPDDLENVTSSSSLSTEPIPTGKKKRRLFLKKQAQIEAQIKAETRLRQSNTREGDENVKVDSAPIARKTPFFNPATKMGLIAHDIVRIFNGFTTSIPNIIARSLNSILLLFLALIFYFFTFFFLIYFLFHSQLVMHWQHYRFLKFSPSCYRFKPIVSIWSL